MGGRVFRRPAIPLLSQAGAIETRSFVQGLNETAQRRLASAQKIFHNMKTRHECSRTWRPSAAHPVLAGGTYYMARLLGTVTELAHAVIVLLHGAAHEELGVALSV